VVALAHGEMVKQMLTWNSPLSIGFDHLFGSLPSIFLLMLCTVGIYFGSTELISSFTSRSANQPSKSITIDPITDPEDEDNERFSMSPETSVQVLLLSLGGMFGSIAMIAVTLGRQQAEPKYFLILGLCLGLTSVLFLFYKNWNPSIFQLNSLSIFPAMHLSISIVAIKHIFMLTRA
jgi:hypothetical protein